MLTQQHVRDNCSFPLRFQVFKELKLSNTGLTTAYIRTDNAGCYKGSDTLLSVEKLYQATGVFVRRIDFSDAQSGKGPCDRMAAVTKSNIRRFINEKNDCVTSSDFVNAAKSTQYMTIMACRLSTPATVKKTKWPGIQNFNNIQYDLLPSKIDRRSKTTESEMKVTVWRAFGIGTGQTFQWKKLHTLKDDIAPIQTSVRHDNDEWQDDSSERGTTASSIASWDVSNIVLSGLSGRSDRDDALDDIPLDAEAMDVDEVVVTDQHSSSFVTFDCTEPHCVMQFRREDRLRAHLLLGSHKIITPSFRLLDRAAILYKKALESDKPKAVPVLSASTAAVTTANTAMFVMEEGWALFRAREKVPFTLAQRSYLNQKYDEGEKSGAKWDASTVAEARAIRFTRKLNTYTLHSCFSTCRRQRDRANLSSSLTSFSARHR